MPVDEKKNKEFLELVKKYKNDPHDQKISQELYNFINIWLTIFYVDYQKMWGNRISKDEYDDIKSEIILKIFTILQTNEFPTYYHIRSYLLKVFQTKCRDRIRKKSSQFLRFEEQINSESLIFSFEDASSQFSLKDKFDVVSTYWQLALKKSDEAVRTIIVSLYMGMPYEAICEKLEISEYSQKNFKVQVFRAKKKFKKTLLNILESALSESLMSSIEKGMIKEIITGIKKNP